MDYFLDRMGIQTWSLRRKVEKPLYCLEFLLNQGSRGFLWLGEEDYLSLDQAQSIFIRNLLASLGVELGEELAFTMCTHFSFSEGCLNVTMGIAVASSEGDYSCLIELPTPKQILNNPILKRVVWQQLRAQIC